jgi:hypothetical protein
MPMPATPLDHAHLPKLPANAVKQEMSRACLIAAALDQHWHGSKP